jgi:hypothetical protein
VQSPIASARDDKTPSGRTPGSAPAVDAIATAAADAEATTRAYIAILNAAFTSGEASSLDDIAAEDCPCHKFISGIADFVQEGGTFQGARWDIARIDMEDVSETSAVAEVHGSMGPYKQIDKDGVTQEDSQGGQVRIDYFLVRYRGRWMITNAFNLRS